MSNKTGDNKIPIRQFEVEHTGLVVIKKGDKTIIVTPEGDIHCVVIHVEYFEDVHQGDMTRLHLERDGSSPLDTYTGDLGVGKIQVAEEAEVLGIIPLGEALRKLLDAKTEIKDLQKKIMSNIDDFSKPFRDLKREINNALDKILKKIDGDSKS